MKIKFRQIDKNEQFVHKGKPVRIGDEIDLPKDRAEHYIEQGKAEEVKSMPSKQQKESKSDSKE